MDTWVDRDARIVIVDDHQPNIDLLRRMLEGVGYEGVVATTNSSEAIALCTGPQADLLLLDLHMPAPDGYQVMEQLRDLGQTFPVIVLTADDTSDAKLQALGLGARDFLIKPFDRSEVLLRIENHLQIQLLQRELRRNNEELEAEVQRRTSALDESRRETLERLALLSEYRDDDTGEHVQRVGRCCAQLAATIGMPAEDVHLIRQAATLHDIGKVGVPDSILLKPGRLTDEEFDAMKMHVALSEQILTGSQSRLLQYAELIARTHHERWDGTGYPRGLAGEEIPLAGRITALADVFDALTHDRPYKEAWSVERAVAEIRAQSGRHFDPDVVDAFERLDHEALLKGTEPQVSVDTNPARNGRAAVPAPAERA